MTIDIIEDSGPYYIRFGHDSISDIIRVCQENLPDLSRGLSSQQHPGFTHHRLPRDQGLRILDLVPFSRILDFHDDRVSLFITHPGYYYRAHKDGLDNRISINYPIVVRDQACVTRWYDEDDLEAYEIDNLPNMSSRECQGFDKHRHVPVKTMTARIGEGILFNTDIFHDFDNSLSEHYRVVLTLRLRPPLKAQIDFDRARALLFTQ